MIRVVPAPEPGTFDANVRQPGLRTLRNLAERDYDGSVEAIPSARFPPYWRESLDDLLESYRRICSYLCLYIHRGTGARSVEHMVAKSVAPDAPIPSTPDDSSGPPRTRMRRRTP